MFFLGLILGAMLGIVCYCLVIVSGDDEEWYMK